MAARRGPWRRRKSESRCHGYSGNRNLPIFGLVSYHGICRTGYIGKWHLDGRGRSSFIPPERRQGFEYWRAAECTHAYNRSLYYADDGRKRFWKGYVAKWGYKTDAQGTVPYSP